MLERAGNKLSDRGQPVASRRKSVTANAGGLYSLRGVIVAALVYSALHIAARLIASGNLGEDDPLDAIFTQTLALGYHPGQPPLYDWALWLIGQVTGPGALRFQLLKYGLLTATCAFIFMSARRVMKGDALWALIAVEALALIYQISWRFHEGFTHAVGAMCAVAATFWAVTRLGERRRLGDYVVLGLCAGLGVLTVPTFWVFLAALIGAACLQPSLRRIILDPRIALTAGVAALIAAPHFVWLAGTPEGLAAILPAMVTDGRHGHWHFVLLGIRRAITEPVMYLSPLIFLYPLFFPRFLANLRSVRLAPNAAAEPDCEQLILHLTLFSIGALLLGAFVYGINRYPVHALMPLFLVTSIWLTAQARKVTRSPAEVRRFAIMAISVAVFAFCARAANMYVLEPVCKLCRWGVPYDELAADMKRICPSYRRIIVYDDELGGNLLRFFRPYEERVELAGLRAYAPPRWPKPVKCEVAYVWPASDSIETAAARFQLAPELLQKAETISIPWRHHFWKPDGYRVSRWRVAPLY